MAEPNSSAPPTVNVQMATQNATKFLQNLAPQIGGEVGGQITDVRLEEVELSEDEQFWFVTLGFERPIDDPFSGVLQQRTERSYKQFKVDAATGEVKAMKIRTI